MCMLHSPLQRSYLKESHLVSGHVGHKKRVHFPKTSIFLLPTLFPDVQIKTSLKRLFKSIEDIIIQVLISNCYFSNAGPNLTGIRLKDPIPNCKNSFFWLVGFSYWYLMEPKKRIQLEFLNLFLQLSILVLASTIGLFSPTRLHAVCELVYKPQARVE